MVKIATFVFFDLETTGLPHLERNSTKITELCFVAVSRNDIENAPDISKLCASKLSLLFNPQKNIQQRAAEITGLSNEMLKNAPIFKEKIDTICTFLKELPAPVCLIAHNGDIFDYKILLAEFLDISETLPADLLCVDSLKGFKSILRNNCNKNYLPSSQTIVNDSLTDEDWSELDISNKDWESLDALCNSFSEMPIDESTPKKVQKKRTKAQGNKNICYTLKSLYERFLGKEVINAHRAEDDCMMLLECVIAAKEFLKWADRNCKVIHSIEPLDRKKYVI